MQNANTILMPNPRPGFGVRVEPVSAPSGNVPASDIEYSVSSGQRPGSGETGAEDAQTFTLQPPDTDGSPTAELGFAFLPPREAESKTSPAPLSSAEVFTKTHKKPDQALTTQRLLPTPTEAAALLTRSGGESAVGSEASDIKNPSPIIQNSTQNGQGTELTKFRNASTPHPISKSTNPDVPLDLMAKLSPKAVAVNGLPIPPLPSSSKTFGKQESLSGNTGDSPKSSALERNFSQATQESMSPALTSGSGTNNEGHSSGGTKPVITLASASGNTPASARSDASTQKQFGAELSAPETKSNEPPRIPISIDYTPQTVPIHDKIETGLVTTRNAKFPSPNNSLTLNKPDVESFGPKLPPTTPMNTEPEIVRSSVWQEHVMTSPLSKSGIQDAYTIKSNHSELLGTNSTLPIAHTQVLGEVIKASGSSAVAGNDPSLLPVSTNVFPTGTQIPNAEAALSRHIASQISEIARSVPDRPVDLTLNPEELGRVRLSFSSENGVLSVSVTAERPETLDLMRRHIETLAQELRNIGYRDVNIGFGQSGKNPNGSTFGQADEIGNEPSTDTQIDLQASSNKHLTAAPSNLLGETGIDLRL